MFMSMMVYGNDCERRVYAGQDDDGVDCAGCFGVEELLCDEDTDTANTSEGKVLETGHGSIG